MRDDGTTPRMRIAVEVPSQAREQLGPAAAPSSLTVGNASEGALKNSPDPQRACQRVRPHDALARARPASEETRSSPPAPGA